MLRRKLLLILLCVTALLLSLALAAVWSMRDIHHQLERITVDDVIQAERANLLSIAASDAEAHLYGLGLDRSDHREELLDTVARMRTLAEQLDHPDASRAIIDLARHIVKFEQHVVALTDDHDPELALHHHAQGLDVAQRLREEVLALNQRVHRQAHARLTDLTSYFRWLVIGIAAGFLVVINGSILLLLRSSEMIARPVDRLVAASRALAAGDYAHRVTLAGHDEFDELGAAFNHLAAQLQDNEHRRVELLGQVALTLNHELNNAMAVIDLELTLLSRRQQDPIASKQCLHEIGENLHRMARVVESLKHVRRIVLRDYLGDTKMLDLEQSVLEGPAPHRPRPV